MPKRKRHQEIKRRLSRLLEQERRKEAEAARQAWLKAVGLPPWHRGPIDVTQFSADPLADEFWREQERVDCRPDDDCYWYCPHDPMRDARVEIQMFRESEESRA